MYYLCFIFVFCSFLLFAKTDVSSKDSVVDFNYPQYQDGVFSTTKGGMLENEHLHIHAKSIEYKKKLIDGKLVHTLKAQKNIVVQFQDRIFTGDSFEYNFITKKGCILDGKTFAPPWYLSAEKIFIDPKKEFYFSNLNATTSVDENASWNLRAKNATLIHNSLFEAKHITFRVAGIPTFWFPYYRVNLKNLKKEPLIRYKLTWDKGQGPRATLRYELFSWKYTSFFLRGDYRYGKSFGGALEAYFTSEMTRLMSRNYLAKDILPNDPRRKRRYRFQGEGRFTSEDHETKFDIFWDRYSDILMPGDFHTEDFEINTSKQTKAFLRHREGDFFTIGKARLQANPFETVQQELPFLLLRIKPISLGKSKIISQNQISASYLAFAYSDDLSISLDNFHSTRLEANHELYRKIPIGPAALTPSIGVIGIYYNDSPTRSSVAVGVLQYKLKLLTRLAHHYKTTKHSIEPYIQYTGLSRPTSNLDKRYIFSIDDGINRLNQLQIGLRNLFQNKKKLSKNFCINLYVNGYFAAIDIGRVFPKMYLDFEWNLPMLEFVLQNAWNFRHQVLDYSNFHTGFTINENFAIQFDLRYRSKYDWRKADRENFILDVTRNEQELLSSSISDRRMTFLTNFFIRLSPYWSCHVQTHHGWDRINEPPYHEWKIDLYTLIYSSWKVRLSYLHTETDDRITAGINLIKK